MQFLGDISQEVKTIVTFVLLLPHGVTKGASARCATSMLSNKLLVVL